MYLTISGELIIEKLILKNLKRESYLSYLLASATQPEPYPYIRALTVRAATMYCENLISFLNLSEELSKCEFKM